MQASDGRREAGTVGVEPAHADRERRGRGWHVPSAAAFVVHGHHAAPRRTTRALALTATAVAVGVGAHVLAGGLVSVTGIAAAFPVLLGLFWSLAGRERDWLPIAGAQLAGQQVVHSLLDLTSPPMSGSVFIFVPSW